MREDKLDIFEAHIIKNECYITGTNKPPVKQAGIIVHSTGANNPYLKRYVDAPNEVGTNIYGNHWNQHRPDGRQVGVHAFIGRDEQGKIRIAEIMPDNIEAWAVGSGSKGSYNFTPFSHFQFEICEDDLTDEAYFHEVFDVAARYTALKCKQLRLTAGTVVSHAEAHRLGYGGNHGDPEHWLKRYGKDMDWFRDKVKKYIQADKDKEVKPVSKKFTIKEFTITIGDDGTIQIGGSAQADAVPVQPIQPEQPAETAVKPVKSVEEIAREVIRGDWGSGTTRKSKLVAAGYDYKAVQDCVNRLMG